MDQHPAMTPSCLSPRHLANPDIQPNRSLPTIILEVVERQIPRPVNVVRNPSSSLTRRGRNHIPVPRRQTIHSTNASQYSWGGVESSALLCRRLELRNIQTSLTIEIVWRTARWQEEDKGASTSLI